MFAAGYLGGDLLRARLQLGRDAGIVLVEGIWTALLLAWLVARHPGWVRSVGWPRHPWEEAREAAVFGAILYGVVALAVALPLSRAIGRGGGAIGPPQGPAASAVGIPVALGSALLVAPAAEELFFRGLLFRALRQGFGTAPAAVASALAFGLVHLSRGTRWGP